VKLVDTGPAVDALRRIGERLTPGSRFRYRWYVGERSDVNAFALPGGIVIVHAGLIEAAVSPEELAAVIAHEVAHAELRHGLKASIQKLGLTGLSRILFFGASDRFAQAAATAGERKFSRDAEREADLDGLSRLIDARIDPQAMLTFFETLARHARTGGSALMASHPPTEERLAALRDEITRRKKAGISSPVPLGVDWAAVRASIRH
jgi:predicted Zn-dependent protease